MSVAGFDVGNENCVIAGVKQEVVDVFLNDESKRETPTVVCFGEKQRFLGAAGAASASMNPKSTISEIKWLIGRCYNDEEVQIRMKTFPFEILRGDDDGVRIRVNYRGQSYTFTPVEIMAMVFSHLKEIAEKNLQKSVVNCVIGIPSYFSDLQRRAYLHASKIAGLQPLRLMHDSTAAALSYGIYKSDFSNGPGSVVVFVDIGQCDMQVSVVNFKHGSMITLSHAFDSCLGGRDFDEVLFRHFAKQFDEKYEINVNSNVRASMRLRAACEKLKKVLSANTEAPLNIECLMEERDLKGFIRREEFEMLSEELLKRIATPCIKALDEAGVTVNHISCVELVGSGSRIPCISKMLSNVFHREPSRTLNSSECIARGCALQCAMLSPHFRVRNYEVLDSFPFSVALSDFKNPALPLAVGVRKLFPSVKVYQFRRNRKFHLETFYADTNKLPPGPRSNIGGYDVAVPGCSEDETVLIKAQVLLDIHGIIRIKFATDKNDLHVKEKINGEMSEDALREAQENEKKFSNDDRDVEEANNRRNTLESYVYETRSKLLDTYASFAVDAEKNEIINRLQDTENWLYGEGEEAEANSYTSKLEDLKMLVDPIENRYKEDKGRVQATQELEEFISYCRNTTAAMRPVEKQQMMDECDRAESWLTEKTEEQRSLAKNVGPVLRSQDIKQIEQHLRTFYVEKMGT